MELLLIALVAGGFLWMLGSAAKPSASSKKNDSIASDSTNNQDLTQ